SNAFSISFNSGNNSSGYGLDDNDCTIFNEPLWAWHLSAPTRVGLQIRHIVSYSINTNAYPLALNN
ncbi:hypothetical protein ACJX0J_006423, partial [Zea mays]